MTDFICPSCRGVLIEDGPDLLRCEAGDLDFPRLGGIWRFLTPAGASYYQDFIRDYETVRRAEGRGSRDPEYYRRLPFEDRSGAMPEMWQMRAASYLCLREKVMPAGTGRRLNVLDLGAGNGWLSYRMAREGHTVVAVDLLVNDWDGLGAHAHYDAEFVPVQAAFDALPFHGRRFYWIVFNASFHYSVDYHRTLSKTIELLAANGVLAIVDTPVYHDESSGREMVAERKAEFIRRYGFASNALPLENFLTFERLQRLADEHALDLHLEQPDFGLKRRLMPFWARLRGRREPAGFPVIELKPRQP